MATESIEILGSAECPWCGYGLVRPVVVVRRWKHKGTSKTANGVEFWHRGCAEAQQAAHAEERALEVLSMALAAM